VDPKGVPGGRATPPGVLVCTCSFSFRARRGSVIARLSGPDQQVDGYEQGPRRLDDVDRLLLSIKDYVQHPDKALRDLGAFVLESIDLMRHIYKPKIFRESVWRSIVVLVVVAAFSSVVLGMDTCLQLLPAALRS